MSEVFTMRKFVRAIIYYRHIRKYNRCFVVNSCLEAHLAKEVVNCRVDLPA